MTAKELIAKLPLIAENVLVEAAHQPMLFIDAARYRVGKMQKRARAGAERDNYMAQLAVSIRRKRSNSGEKITEGNLKEIIEKDPKSRELRKLNDDAFAEEELAKLILEAFRMRRDAIKIIADSRVYEGLRDDAHEEQRMEHRKLLNRARTLEERRQRQNKVED